MEHFRVSRQVANSIAERFEMSDYFKPQSGCYGKLSPFQQTQIFLWFAGHQTASFRDVADRFNITISRFYYLNNSAGDSRYSNEVSPQICTT
jgi:hypothetical protein